MPRWRIASFGETETSSDGVGEVVSVTVEVVRAELVTSAVAEGGEEPGGLEFVSTTAAPAATDSLPFDSAGVGESAFVCFGAPALRPRRSLRVMDATDRVSLADVGACDGFIIRDGVNVGIGGAGAGLVASGRFGAGGAGGGTAVASGSAGEVELVS
jgi:hypothetical protein